MILIGILAALAGLSFALNLWQWFVARRFPLHQRVAAPAFTPAVTLLKPLKGCDENTEACLRSWLAQDYSGEVQVLFAVATEDDPVCGLVRKLMGEFPQRDAELVVCGELNGVNAKVAKLAVAQKRARHDVLIISDADVRVPPDFLGSVVAPLREERVGLVNCFYRLANPSTPAMRWEAFAANVDFWSQVLQARSLKPLDFALGAVMAVRRTALEKIGGFAALTDYLADDYQLGNKIARAGRQIELCPVVVECWDPPMNWSAAWRHQVRWARTIRLCQPAPYFFSILNNATLWPMLWLVLSWSLGAAVCAGVMLASRLAMALDLHRRLTQEPLRARWWWLVPVKDVLSVVVWAAAFAGNTIEWRGVRYRLTGEGKLVRR